VAREEGLPEIADVFKALAVAEADHEARYAKLRENLAKGVVFKRSEKKKWRCRNRGFIHEGPSAPESCPACLHPTAFFELRPENF